MSSSVAIGTARNRMKNTNKRSITIPILSRSFAVASFQSTPVESSALTVMPPNPAACLRVGVWDKTWDKSANYFETARPQFHFCPRDKNGQVLRL